MGLFGEFDKMNWVFSSITLVITYILATIIYRRTLHPLAHVPGPFLASITSLYEFYYDHIRGGQYFFRFDDFVARYGPVVRTGPDKVLLADPDHYDIVYNQHKPFEKAPRLYRTFALGEAMFVQSEPAKYKPQRAALNPFFSRRSVLSQERMIKAKVAKLVQLVTDAGENNPAPLHYGYRAMAMDVVTEYAFGPDICFNLLEREDMGESFDKQVRTTVEGAMHLSKAFPFLLHFLSLPLPDSWTQKIDFMSSFRPVRLQFSSRRSRMREHFWQFVPSLKLEQPVRDGVSRVIDDVDNGIQPAVRTVFHELIEGLSGHTSMSRDTSLRYLMDEGFVIVGAAGDTTGNAMVSNTNSLAPVRVPIRTILTIILLGIARHKGPFRYLLTLRSTAAFTRSFARHSPRRPRSQSSSLKRSHMSWVWSKKLFAYHTVS